MSGIFSGSLSTVSSAINSLAAVTFEDYIKPMAKLSCCKKIETSINEKASFVLKILALIYGCICVAMTFLCNQLGSGMLQAAMSIFGIVGGPLLGLFTLGMLTRQGNEPGTLKIIRNSTHVFTSRINIDLYRYVMPQMIFLYFRSTNGIFISTKSFILDEFRKT